jgi:hypothetical protein
MAKQPKIPVQRSSSSFGKKLLVIPALALLIKLSIISRIQGFDWYQAGNGDMATGLKTLLDDNYAPANVWYGADAENYLRSLLGLLQDGFFSQERNLHYWPAGYPILIWMVGFFAQGSTLAMIAILQSVLYFIACAFFVDEIRQSRLVNFSIPIALILTLNPTLSLNTIAIGYELPTASLALIAIAAMMRQFRKSSKSIFTLDLLVASISMSLATFMQPRLILFAILLFGIWALAKYQLKGAAAFLSVSMLVVLLAPAVMIYRNSEAMGFNAISTNLGVTMNIGGGDEATGGYNGKYNGVDCPEAVGNEAEIDSAKVRCILNWYAQNPVKFLKLSWNKARFFWSPWIGPEASGTMARNPWRINHPLNETIKTPDGANMVNGGFGRAISWLWMISGLIFLGLGFRFLWSAGGIERLWGSAAFSMVIINWLSSIATIGDHRFRIPTMSLSLVLQVIGFSYLFISKRRRLLGSALELSWPALIWKRKSEPDNLQP